MFKALEIFDSKGGGGVRGIDPRKFFTNTFPTTLEKRHRRLPELHTGKSQEPFGWGEGGCKVEFN